MVKLFGLAVAAILAAGAPAEAHTGAHVAGGIAGGLGAGFAHPLFGLDHLLAIVSVGALGAVIGGSALWALPATFMGVMVAGGLLALAGIGLPGVELGIAASLVVFGALLAARIGMPVMLSVAIVAVFALFHGHAHGNEVPEMASPAAYVLGFVAATGLLHLVGIGLAQAFKRLPRFADLSVRMAGGAVAACGLVLILG
ncbi:MAG: HupE/UreJ family protein [Rhodospirillales bacterium]|nr:HupE/UreJ family protein [Rhodospirillales bacterium]